VLFEGGTDRVGLGLGGIPWPVVFAKAYALVAAGSPPLRRVYVKLPWPHLYELPQSVASIIVERDWPLDGDSSEKALFLGRLKAPDTATLPDLAARMLAHKTAPIDGGTVRPRAVAVLRLMTSSNFVGCCTGRTAGLAPLRIFPA
jgi:hypothetical protein